MYSIHQLTSMNWAILILQNEKSGQCFCTMYKQCTTLRAITVFKVHTWDKKRKIKHKTLAHLFNLFGCQRIFICTCPYNLLRESRKKRVNHALCNLQIW